MVGLCGFVFGVGWSSSVYQWNDIIRLWHYEQRKLTTVLASLAVISTASKHLHNDLAKAIEALEQKKPCRRAAGFDLHPHWTCWTAYWSTLSFESPMREHTVLCTIRSLAQTLCYDLARAEKAKDGKKSAAVLQAVQARFPGLTRWAWKWYGGHTCLRFGSSTLTSATRRSSLLCACHQSSRRGAPTRG